MKFFYSLTLILSAICMLMYGIAHLIAMDSHNIQWALDLWPFTAATLPIGAFAHWQYFGFYRGKWTLINLTIALVFGGYLLAVGIMTSGKPELIDGTHTIVYQSSRNEPRIEYVSEEEFQLHGYRKKALFAYMLAVVNGVTLHATYIRLTRGPEKRRMI